VDRRSRSHDGLWSGRHKRLCPSDWLGPNVRRSGRHDELWRDRYERLCPGDGFEPRNRISANLW